MALSPEERKERGRQSRLRWRLANPEKDREAKRRWQRNNPEKRKEGQRRRRQENPDYDKLWRESHADQVHSSMCKAAKKWRTKNPEKAAESARTWRERNPEKIISGRRRRRKQDQKHNNEKYQTDIQYKLARCLRSRLHTAIKKGSKGGSAVRDLGCSIQELKVWLEKQFQPDMTWENWSPRGWHIDHIVPLVKFNLEDPEQCKKACHYTNLQPLWAIDNIRKGGR